VRHLLPRPMRCLPLVLGLLLAHPAVALTINGGVDTFVRQAVPDSSHGGGVVAEWDGSDGGGENHALLRFDIFQSGGGPVDPAAIAGMPNLRAFLRLDVVNTGSSGDLYRMTTPFAEGSTWNSLGGGVLPGVNAVSTPDVVTPDMSVGTHLIDVTSSVQAWAAAPTSNLGWGMVGNGTNGLEFSTFESGNGPELVLGTGSSYVDRGDSWSFYDSILPGDPSYPTDGSGTDWRDITFDDSSWGSGSSQLGFGDGDEATTVSSGNITYLFRTTFMAGDASDELWLELLRDDSAVVYLNGVEVLRDNLPAGAIDATTTASATGTENGLDIFTLDPLLLLSNQQNVIAVEIHNVSTSSSDISFDLGISGFSPFSLAAVPEPSSALLLGYGLALLGAARTRRL